MAGLGGPKVLLLWAGLLGLARCKYSFSSDHNVVRFWNSWNIVDVMLYFVSAQIGGYGSTQKGKNQGFTHILCCVSILKPLSLGKQCFNLLHLVWRFRTGYFFDRIKCYILYSIRPSPYFLVKLR